jgi:hypothetical protein
MSMLDGDQHASARRRNCRPRGSTSRFNDPMIGTQAHPTVSVTNYPLIVQVN